MPASTPALAAARWRQRRRHFSAVVMMALVLALSPSVAASGDADAGQQQQQHAQRVAAALAEDAARGGHTIDEKTAALLASINKALGHSSPSPSPSPSKQPPPPPPPPPPKVPALRGVSPLRADVAVAGAPLRAALAPLLNHTFSVPEAQLLRATAYGGPMQRVRALVAAAIAGRLPNATLRVGVVGGSIAWGHGATKRGANDFFSLVVTWLRAAFPKVRVEARNGCVPGTPAAYMAICLSNHVDDDADLVFVEYTLNDGLFDSIAANARVRVKERLLRRLLALPRRPAVVMLQMPSHGQAFRRGSEGFRPFHVTLEDVYGALALYYDVPSLSMRNAFLNRLGGGESREAADAGGTALMSFDGLHPNDHGHQVMADAVVWLLQSAAVGLALRPPDAAERAYVERGALPEPMYPGNHHRASSVCLYERALEPAVARALSTGFELVNEGTPEKTKWGFVARRPGAALALRVDTTGGANATGAGAAAGAGAAVYVAYLKSYERMGVAEARCVSGCRCEPVTINAHHALRVSTTHLARLDATRDPECTIVVTVAAATDSGQHKFKVLGVMVSQRSHDGAPEYGAAQGAHFPGWEVHTRADAQRAAVLPAPAPAPAPAQAPP